MVLNSLRYELIAVVLLLAPREGEYLMSIFVMLDEIGCDIFHLRIFFFPFLVGIFNRSWSNSKRHRRIFIGDPATFYEMGKLNVARKTLYD